MHYWAYALLGTCLIMHYWAHVPLCIIGHMHHYALLGNVSLSSLFLLFFSFPSFLHFFFHFLPFPSISFHFPFTLFTLFTFTFTPFTRLAAFDTAEALIAARDNAINALEAALFASRDLFNDPAAAAASRDEDRTAIDHVITEMTQWMEDALMADGDDAVPTSAFEDAVEKVKRAGEAVRKRVRQMVERPEAVRKIYGTWEKRGE